MRSSSAVLAKANMRLQQQRDLGINRQSSEEDNIADYLASLRKKTSAVETVEKSKSFKLEGISDVSLTESDASISAPNYTQPRQQKVTKSFIKKSAAPVASATNPVTSASHVHDPRTTSSAMQNSFVKRSNELAFRSSALEKVSMMENRIKRDEIQKSKRDGKKHDIAMVDSLDSSASSASLYNILPASNLAYLADDDSEKLGKSGRKFLKHKNPQQDVPPPAANEPLTSPPPDVQTPRKTSLKKQSSPTTPKKRVTIDASAKQQTSSTASVVGDEENDDDSFKINVQQFDFSDDDDSHNNIGEKVVEVDNLESISSVDEEPQRGGNLEGGIFDKFGVQTIDDIESESENSSRRDDVDTCRKSSAGVISELSEIVSASGRYVSDFETDADTSQRPSANGARSRTISTESYSEDFFTGSNHNDDQRARNSDNSDTLSNSSSPPSHSYTETVSRTIKRKRKQFKVIETKSIDIQTSVNDLPGGISYQWDTASLWSSRVQPSYGMNRVSVAPIATAVVSPEALEAVTAYNPCALALNNLVKDQLEITRDFLETQRLLREMECQSNPDHMYTTLADTKAYVAAHKPPSLTFEEALKEIEIAESIGI